MSKEQKIKFWCCVVSGILTIWSFAYGYNFLGGILASNGFIMWVWCIISI